jgi:hypothetical protein
MTLMIHTDKKQRFPDFFNMLAIIRKMNELSNKTVSLTLTESILMN